jgi:hypothetical protein
MASKADKILAVHLLSSWSLFASGLSAYFGGGLLVLIAGDLNTRHVDWNSRLITRGRYLRDYADKNLSHLWAENTCNLPYNLLFHP